MTYHYDHDHYKLELNLMCFNKAIAKREAIKSNPILKSGHGHGQWS